MVTIATVFAAGFIAKNLLVNRALQAEADFFWDRYRENPDYPLAASLNLTGYLSTDKQSPPPAEVTSFELGQHQLTINDETKIVHVSEYQGHRLFLFFDGTTVGNLAMYFGIIPLIIVLVTMYGLAYLAYLLSKQAVSPITRLASSIEKFDFGRRNANELDLQDLAGAKDSETAILVDALDHFVERSDAFVERERNFTRYASHELRTPLAVIQGSTSSLELLELEGASGRAVQRIKRNSKYMSDLLNTLLVLAREQKQVDTSQLTDVNELCRGLQIQLQSIYENPQLTTEITERAKLEVAAPASAMSIVIGNVLENAYAYTSAGLINIEIDTDSLTIKDTGPGIPEGEIEQIFQPFFRVSDGSSEHQGLGLALVQKTCNNYGWEVKVESTEGQGSCFRIVFHNDGGAQEVSAQDDAD